MSVKQRKEYAKLLYVNQKLTQKDTADQAGVSVKSVNKWVNHEKWDELRAMDTITREQQLRMMYAQINDLNTTIAERDQGNRHASPREADVITKLAAAINSLELELSIVEISNVFKGFNEYFRVRDLELCQKVIVIQDEYLKSKIK